MPSKINPTAVVSARPFNVHQLFEGSDYVIPEYQRDFVWKESHVLQLWKDLREHYRRNTADDILLTSPDAYFLGAIVVLDKSEGKSLEVIDGQQRLTTLTCMAATLYQNLKGIVNRTPDIDGLQAQLDRMVGTYSGGAWKANVTLSPDSMNDFLITSCILRRDQQSRQEYWDKDASAKTLLEATNSPAVRIRKAIEASESQIEEFLRMISSDEDRTRRISCFVQLFAECVVILRIATSTRATAYDLFESLNFRGIALTQADLVKNEIIKLAPDSDDQQDIVENWSELKSSLNTHDALSLPEFLHYSYLSRFEIIKANRLFDSVRSKVAGVGAKTYSEQLLEDARALEKLVHGDTTIWSTATNCMLKDIREILNIKFSYVALLSAFRKLANEKDDFEKVVRMIMNFLFRFMKVLDGEVEPLSRIMHTTAVSINRGDSVADLSSELRKEAPDSAFIEKFCTVGFGNAKMAYFTVYYLERAMLYGTLPVDHGKEQNLEHVMPRSPRTSDWPQVILDKEADPEKFRQYLWRVGNLIPLPEAINKAIKNRGIAHKISNATGKDYSSSTLESPKALNVFLKSGQWTYESIDDRQRKLAMDVAAKAWAL